jgi:hypothetical protein
MAYRRTAALEGEANFVEGNSRGNEIGEKDQGEAETVLNQAPEAKKRGAADRRRQTSDSNDYRALPRGL